VARAIARHLLNHYQQIVQEDVGALRVISTDANGLTEVAVLGFNNNAEVDY
jgi:hypothetical protein